MTSVMGPMIRGAIVFACMWIVCAGCGLAGPVTYAEVDSSEPDLYISAVPFFPQEAYQCGPASLAAVLGYWGKHTSPDEIATAIYSPRLKGTLGLDMWSYAQAQHFMATMQSTTLDELRTFIRQRIPVIAFLELGYHWLPLRHFVVIVGIDPQRQAVVAYNGREQNSRIPFPTFLQAWEKTNYWTLIVRPRSDV